MYDQYGNWHQVGLDQYVGYDVIVGNGAPVGMVGPQVQLQGGQQRASIVPRGFFPVAAPAAPPPAPMIMPDPAVAAREEPIGFPLTNVPANGTLAITTRPEYTFRPSRLVVPASIAANFMINDLKIANRSVFQNAVPIPAETFTQVAVGVALALATATVGQSIVIEVNNLDAQNAHNFFATLIGTTVKP